MEKVTTEGRQRDAMKRMTAKKVLKKQGQCCVLVAANVCFIVLNSNYIYASLRLIKSRNTQDKEHKK